MKKLLAAGLCLTMCVWAAPLGVAAAARDLDIEHRLASQLKELGLFLGVGEKENGTTDFALERAPNRTEALTMLVRALGKEAPAQESAKTHPFSDVPDWADGYVSYAYTAGLTKGVSEDRFGAADTASAEMYLTFMLRALGYTEGDSGDFSWDAPWTLAEECGILPQRVDRESFLRADVVDVTCAALFADIKGEEITLQEKLISEGAFTAADFTAAFPEDSFPEERGSGQQTPSTGAYEAAVKQVTSTVGYQETQRLEAEVCTVLLYSNTGLPHGNSVSLRLIYKAGAALEEGTVISLPTPDEHGWGITHSDPQAMDLSQDGLTLRYSYHYDEAMINDGQVCHQAGTYQYTADLRTGETALEIIPDEA